MSKIEIQKGKKTLRGKLEKRGIASVLKEIREGKRSKRRKTQKKPLGRKGES